MRHTHPNWQIKMQTILTNTFFLIVSILLVRSVDAQHDPHRNATQAIAVNQLKKAEKELAKADNNDPETHFVKMMLALKENNMASALTSARSAVNAGLPFSRLLVGPRHLLKTLHDMQAFQEWAASYRDLTLLHGPMLGELTDHSASFWLRTTNQSQVAIQIGKRISSQVATGPDTDFTAIVKIDGLSAATNYTYQVLIDERVVQVENAQFTTYPKMGGRGQFAVAFGGGAGYVPQWESMWDTISGFQPAALLMLGDNVYIDQPRQRLCQQYCYYRRQTRPEWRRLVAATSTYAIYDDHDFGTNDCAPGPDIESPPWKRNVWNTFRQNWINPSYGGGESQPGCWFDFHVGDVHFILLDGRYYRDLPGGSMLGPVQKTWLLETLKKSHSTFKVVASPVPWSEGTKPGKDTWDGFPAEREAIFSFIEAHRINGVFLISADRHRTDLRITKRPNGYNLFELESSRLTNRHTHQVIKTPGLVWGYSDTCSFALMQFDTTTEDPQVTLQCVNIEGEVIHRHTLRASQLQHQ